MDKPIDLIVIETKEKLAKVITESKLPSTIISMILHQTTAVIDGQIPATIDTQKKRYEESLKKDKKEQ